jgi:hypothetical protein
LRVSNASGLTKWEDDNMEVKPLTQDEVVKMYQDAIERSGPDYAPFHFLGQMEARMRLQLHVRKEEGKPRKLEG